MKVRVFLISFLFSFSSFGEVTTISPQTFKQYILPSLKKLVEDYYDLLVKLDPFNKEIISLKKNTIELEKKWQDFTKSCFESMEKCKKDFSLTKNEFVLGNQEVLKVENGFKLTPQISKGITNSRILMANTISSISDDAHKIIISLDLFKFKRKEFFEITDHLKNMKLNLNILTTGFLANEYQDNFYFIYSNFFKMLENDIIGRSNIELFSRELVNLNISWNTFNMKVPKWKSSLSADSMDLIESMHKRWNSILKLIWGN
jgi:hypothetical protein